MELTKYDWVLGALVGAAIVTFIFMIPAAMGEQTVKTVEIPIGYIAQTTANTDYIQTITMKPPDGIEELNFFEIVITGDFQASTDISARVRKTGAAPVFDCTPSTWTTPNTNSPNYKAAFDCSALTDEYDFTTGKIDVGFRTSRVAQNVKGDLKITYYNNPKGQLSVFGTEYVANENGTVFLQLLDDNRDAIMNASCLLDIYYPDKSMWKDDTPMYYQDDGLYYYDLIIPEYLGVYMTSVMCYWELAEGDTETADLFNLTHGTIDSGVLSDTYTSNNDYHVIEEETDPELPNLAISYTFTDVNATMVKELDIHLEYQWEYYYYGWQAATEDLNIEFYNYSSSSWYLIPQNITGSSSDTMWDWVLNDNASNFISGGNVSIRFYDYLYDSSQDIFRIDHFHITSKYLDGEIIDEIRGSGELHVNDWFTNITTIAESSFDEAKFVGATEYVTGDEGKFMVQYIRTIAGSPSPENAANCTVNVTYPNGTLHLINYQLDYLTGSNGIYEKTFTVPSTVGVYTADYYCLKAPKSVYGSDTFHVSYPINATAISENVWEYPTRNLTYYPPFDYPQMSEYVWNYSDRQVNLTQVLEAVDALNDSTQSYFVVIENGILGLTNVSAFEIWNFTNRSLTTDEVVLHVSGTEYATGEEGTVWNILYRITPSGTYTPINDADCEAYIRYPNATNFIVNGTMEYITGSFGFYRYNFTVPNTTGVYVGGVLCKDATREYIETGTFHVAEWANYISGLNNQTFDYAEAALYNWNLTTRTLTDYNQTGILNYLLNINTTTWDTNYWVKQNNDILINLTLGNVTVFANINWTRLRMEVWNKTTPEKLEHDILSFADDEIVLVETRDFCTDNTTLMHQLNVTRCILSTCWDDNTENPEMCDWGCFENKCRPDPMWSNLWLILIIIMIGVGMYVVNAVVK